MKKYSPFYDPAKALSHCELILDEIVRPDLHVKCYEFFFNSFILYINQTWDQAWKLYNDKIVHKGINLAKDINAKRYGNDDLLVYLRQARNQLAHRETVLWVSDEEEKPNRIGKSINFKASSFATEWQRYSCSVLPSFEFNSGTEVALKPIYDKKGKLIEVPTKHMGKSIDNTPTNILKLVYEYYGSNFSKIVIMNRE